MSETAPNWTGLFDRVEQLLDRLEPYLPAPAADAGIGQATAYRWSGGGRQGSLLPVTRSTSITLDDLLGIERQRDALERNTRQFVTGRPANHALLWGSRGTGKSSLVKALLNAFAGDGLRLVELQRDDMPDLNILLDKLAPRLERFILYCDDLSFEAGETGYKVLKAALDGGIAEVPDNVLVYATSNRRHLVPEYLHENLESRLVGEELHHGEAIEEKISLSERFGIWLSFHPFNQDTYLAIVHAWLSRLSGGQFDADEVREEALRWALEKGSRSGRSAWQFARDWVGRKGL